MAQKLKKTFHGKTIILVTILSFLVLSNHSFAQSNGESTMEDFRKNTFHGGLGFLILYGTATMNYERVISQNSDKFFTASFIKIGFGAYSTWGDNGQYLISQYGVMTGKKSNHLELSAGPNIVLSGDMEFPVAFGLGYRH